MPSEVPVTHLQKEARGLEKACPPPDHLRRRAISHFRDNYASTFLCFLRPQQLIDDDIGSELPFPLLLCIITLASRHIEELSSGESPSAKADYYAALAQKELGRTYEEPSLVNIQCCLLLCIYEIGEGFESRGWLRLSHAAKLSQLLLLHKQDCELGQMDWGELPSPMTPCLSESKRRTFWCCFCLERLLANGRDRVVTFLPEDITTQFPQTDGNFIYGRHVPTCTLTCPASGTSHQSHTCDNLMAYTIRIVDAFSKVASWNGRGGRYKDARCPWLPEMPFSLFDGYLSQWEGSLPSHLKYTSQNASAIIAVGQGKLWSLMWMVYFQARAYLHREYLPFTPKPNYDPVKGPCDGPTLEFNDVPQPGEFWYNSAATMIKSANAISDLYLTMETKGLSPSAYPMPGLGLLTAASIHVVYSIFGWESMQQVVTQESSQAYLRQDMDAFNHLGQRWSLAIHWIRQISLYYKLNNLTKRSWTDGNNSNILSMDIRDIRDGIMNYVRQISPRDREARDTDLKPVFDFEGWLSVMESSMGRNVRPRLNSSIDTNGNSRATLLSDGDFRTSQTSEHPSLNHGFYSLDGLAAIPFQNRDIEWIFDGSDNWATIV